MRSIMKARILIDGTWHWVELTMAHSGAYNWKDERGADLNVTADSIETAVSYIFGAYPGCELR